MYLIHLNPPYKHARHYIGYADDIGRRFYEHEMLSKGSRLLTVAVAAGCSLHLARIWPGKDRKFERSLKGGKDGNRTWNRARLCPICTPGVKCETT